MAFDALSLSVLTKEFNQTLVGGKITKVYQPERDEIVLFVFCKQTYKLVISANAGVNRIHLTNQPTDNPKVAPAFCMLLRKHLTNATIKSVWQMPYERVIDFALVGTDELGYKKDLHLIFELTGKTSNVIVTDGNYVVLDSVKHLPQDIDTKRIILSGAKYNFFLPQDKIAPDDTAKIRALLDGCNLPLRALLCDKLLGVSQTTVNEILHGIDENDHTIVNHSLVVDRIAYYLKNVASPQPNVVMVNGAPTEVCPFDYQSKRGQKIFFATLNEAHDNYYFLLDKTQRFNDKAKSVNTVVKNAISRTEKKLAIQRQSVLEAEQRELFKTYGDLILSNIWAIKPQDENLVCVNYADGNTVTIALDKQLLPQQNAQAYYKKYQKLKSSALHNGQLVQQNAQLLDYLLSIKQSLRHCTEADDLQQIRDELETIGLIKQPRQQKKKVETPCKPLQYLIDGYAVYVGKNNLQNNHVTFKIAKPNDVWLHTQKIHSSHVVIVNDKNTPVPNDVILKASEICAFYSQAQGDKIPVDYTPRNYVKKPNKAPLGFVVYSTCQTVLVTPNRHPEYLA